MRCLSHTAPSALLAFLAALPCARAASERGRGCRALAVDATSVRVDARALSKRAERVDAVEPRKQRLVDEPWATDDVATLQRSIGAKICGQPKLVGRGGNANIWRIEVACDGAEDCSELPGVPAALKDYGVGGNRVEAEAEANTLRYLSPALDIIPIYLLLLGEVGGLPTVIEELATTSLWHWIYVDRRLSQLEVWGKARTWPRGAGPEIEATSACEFDHAEDGASLLGGAQSNASVNITFQQRGRLLSISKDGEAVAHMEGVEADILVPRDGLSCFAVRPTWSLEDRRAYFKRATASAGRILRGLDHMARFQIVHRDIKPGNVLLVCERGQRNCRAKLSDFGFACWSGLGHRAGKAQPPPVCGDVDNDVPYFAGTHTYIPPEIYRSDGWQDVARSESEVRDRLKSDVWSAGVLLWELFSGDLPRSMREWRREFDEEHEGRGPSKVLRFGSRMTAFVAKPSGPEGRPARTFDPANTDADLEELWKSLAEAFPLTASEEELRPAREVLRLLSRMLQRDPKKRCTAAEAYTHMQDILRAVDLRETPWADAPDKAQCLPKEAKARYTPRSRKVEA